MAAVSSPARGRLFVVGTPIGNLEDITLRALRVLAQVAVIACEDTRRTRRLLARHGISTPLVAYHEHNERVQAPALVARLQAGEDVALVSDAGMPGISDPGYHLVRQAAEAGIPVVAVPGPSAVTAALSVAGLPTDRFYFLGFLPRSAAARRQALRAVADLPATLVLFEAPGRVARTLADVAAVLGPRRVAVVREATKVHEEVRRGRADELAARLAGERVRGEVTVVVEGRPRAQASEPTRAHAPDAKRPEAVEPEAAALLAQGLSRRDVARVLAASHGLSHRDAYALALRVRPLRRHARPPGAATGARR